MKNNNQNIALASLDDSLIPGSFLVDGRTERDMLCFLVDFASLVNFYDNTNQINGNWKPFLLKDPVFLAAWISKINYSKIHFNFVNTCAEIENFLLKQSDLSNLSYSFNRLFNQITHVFIHIDRWISFMIKSDEEYDLKKYTLHHVKSEYAQYLWAINSLRDHLFNTGKMIGLEQVNQYLFNDFDERIWKWNKGKTPYWELLELKYPLDENNHHDFFTALLKAGNKIFSFFLAVIQHSKKEFELLKTQKSRYPDTMLLRTFVKLFGFYQEEMNKISGRHLRFYYEDILKQQRRPVIPDKVFLTLDLAKPNKIFTLPKGSLFNAGLDSNKNPIVFESVKKECFNPSIIQSAVTLFSSANADKTLSLYQQEITSTGVIKKDGNGRVEKWNMFGATSQIPKSKTSMSIAFGSPILYLKEGDRRIMISLEIDQDVELTLFTNATFYLSTQKAWLNVKEFISVVYDKDKSKKSVAIFCNLNVTQPPIESFAINPDGISCQWPMMKIMFDSFNNLSQPPTILSITFKATVWGVKTLQLNNDFGALTAKTPFMPFGPTPNINSNFFIGSQEIFSKPFDFLNLTITWDKLPENFQSYYQEYNTYLNAPPLVPKTSNFLRRILNFIKSKFKSSEIADLIAQGIKKVDPFNNFSFRTDFELLNEGTWEPFSVVKVQECKETVVGTLCVQYQNDPTCKVPNEKVSDLLFSTDGKNCNLTNSSSFAYCMDENTKLNYTPDPAIQLSPLKFGDTALDGFMKMTLAGTKYGFGLELYPKVVSYIALQNALIISNKGGSPLLPAANVPFSPKITEFSVNYSASSKHTLNYGEEDYPLQCFFYSPFKNYLVYDSTQNSSQYSDHIGTSVTSPKKIVNGVPIFPFFNYKAALFLKVSNLIKEGALNIYFELARMSGTSENSDQPSFYYLSTKGWEELTLLSDTTNSLNCSGILTVQVPADISSDVFLMPENFYWISIAVNDPDQYAQAFFLSTNGFLAERVVTSTASLDSIAAIKEGTIAKTQNSVPQIASVLQPFSSFGGVDKENEIAMNQRVSRRIKSKDRVSSVADYYMLIRQNFPDIFYSKTYSDFKSKSIRVNVVKKISGTEDSNAFFPMVSRCQEIAIRNFIQARSSAFSNIVVSNFEFIFVQATISISIQTGYEFNEIKKNINNAIKVFMAPWITSSATQIEIDAGIDNTELAKFVDGIAGVLEVNGVTFKTFTESNGQREIIEQSIDSIPPVKNGFLLVPYDIQIIQLSS